MEVIDSLNCQVINRLRRDPYQAGLPLCSKTVLSRANITQSHLSHTGISKNRNKRPSAKNDIVYNI